MKENIKSVVVLTAICLVVAVLLAYTNSITAPIIEANKAAKASGSLLEVMPEASGFENITDTLANLPATVKEVHRETSGLGHVMILGTTSQFSSGEMGITVAIGADGKISNVLLTGYYESKDFGADYPSTYIGQDSALGGVDTVAGTTFSSTAFKNAITDAFNVLIENNLVAAGEKSEEQLIGEVMPLAIPGCTNSLGECITEPIDAPDASVTQAFKAKNGTGYIYVMTTDAGTVVVGVNAFGEAQGFDLEGNAISDTAVRDAAKAFNPVLTEATNEGGIAAATAAYDEGAVANVTPVSVTEFKTITGAFKVELTDGTVEYVFISQPVAYGNEAMKMLVRVTENGEVAAYKFISEIILHSEYYSDYTLDTESYVASLIGLTSDSAANDDIFLISGATMTSEAVKSSIRDSLSAVGALKEVVA